MRAATGAASENDDTDARAEAAATGAGQGGRTPSSSRSGGPAGCAAAGEIAAEKVVYGADEEVQTASPDAGAPARGST